MAAAARRAGARVSLTTGSNPSVNAAIAGIAEQAWTPIHYPDAFVDPDTGELVSDAEVAEVPYTAFAGQPERLRAPGRLIVRRVKRLNPVDGQDGLFDAWRHHAVFTTSPYTARKPCPVWPYRGRFSDPVRQVRKPPVVGLLWRRAVSWPG